MWPLSFDWPLIRLEYTGVQTGILFIFVRFGFMTIARLILLIQETYVRMSWDIHNMIFPAA